MQILRRSRPVWRHLGRGQALPSATPSKPLRDVRWVSASAAGCLLGAAGLLTQDAPVLAKEVDVQQEVWTWGRRNSIPGGADRDVLRPKRIEWFQNHKGPGWKKLAFGPCFGVALDCNGAAFVWGMGERETEDGAEETFVSPTPLDAQGVARGQCFVDVQCSSEHIFVLTARGDTYVFENVPETLRRTNTESQAKLKLVGQRMPGIPHPNLLHRFCGGGGVRQMSIGLEHAAFVTHRGELICTGANHWGQCGENPPKGEKKMGALEEVDRVETVTPVRVTFPANASRIVSVSVGGQHTVAMDDKGQAFAFGDDRRIQLGLGDTRTAGYDESSAAGVLNRDNLGGKGVKTDIKRALHYGYYDKHMQVAPVETIPPPVQNRPPYVAPSFIVCGQDFSIALHRDSPDWYSEAEETNVLFCCGENGEGQCGRIRQHQQQSWHLVRLPKRSRTVGVACGQGHSIAQMASGELYAWGMNQQGEVGNGSRASTCPPAKLTLEPAEEDGLSRKAVAVACGFRNSGCICEARRAAENHV